MTKGKIGYNVPAGQRYVMMLCSSILCFFIAAFIMALIQHGGISQAKMRIAMVVQDVVMFILPAIATAVVLSSEAHRFVVGLFSSVGKVTEVTESQMNAVTGISGSGPAYVFLFLKALVSAGIAQGLSEDQARSLAVQTLKGGAEMADSSPCGFSDLIAAVSSKGGTTVAALEQFSRCGFEECVRQSVAAAVRRAEELAE